ncbi:MAG: response regulator transcription factor [Planctomycetota bacterium]|jgi:two-component system response regulator DctR
MRRGINDKSGSHVFVVDDDVAILESICLYLKTVEYECSCFENVDDCLGQLSQRNCDLLITDFKMPVKTGLELLIETKRIVPWVPILVMTGYADIPLSVKAMKAGADDFVEKPLEWTLFLSQIRSLLEKHDFENILKGKSLTETEKIVLQMILQDKTSNEIARALDRSVRTIEVHRNHIMHKLDVHSIVNLVKRAVEMGLNDGC